LFLDKFTFNRWCLMGNILRLIGSLLLVFVITGLGGIPLNANGGTEWLQFHQDAANSGNTTSTAPSDNSLLWVSDDIGAAESSSVAVADSKVFVYANDNVTCLNESTGAVVWRSAALEAPSWDSWSSPAYHNGNVFIGSGTKVYSLDATDGSINWSYDIPSDKEVTNGRLCPRHPGL
jgi:outer membrane protein assembly factor BamB